MALSDELRRDVLELAGTIGERHVRRPAALRQAADFVAAGLSAAGAVQRRTSAASGVPCENLDVEIPGSSKPGEIVVVGGHYDSVFGCAGANDNASGVAATLALARRFAGRRPARTLRFAGFVNEEPPHFRTPEMGSRVYASGCRARGERIVAMLSLETIGYYSDRPGSQKYPPGVGLCFPSQGDFIAFVGNLRSFRLVRRCRRLFRKHSDFPCEAAALPGFLPGVGWSDHESFWESGYPAVMVTDTAPFRYPQYHREGDTPDQLDYLRCARVVEGLAGVIEDLTAG
jgi:Zn-dependent M28 family amino/carboxypeptidase